MSRIAARFDALRKAGRKALVPYITAGDPRPGTTVPLMHALVAAGADIIELGVPFSDPMADGPVIQRASERALAHHVTLRDVLAMAAEFRTRDAETPVVFMGYLNLIEAMGYESFARAAAAAAIDGVLTVDMPPEEAAPLAQALESEGVDPIFLVAPTTGRERLGTIGAAARGFIYYVSLKGVTGAANLDVVAVQDRVADIRAASDLPVAVGFGIRDAASAAAVARVADGAVVGSALVSLVEELRDADDEAMIGAVAARLGEMRAAIDGAAPVDAVAENVKGRG